ncbi:hypothetical protein B0H17DRAFT_1127728 [Mycena rosella]|uniref:Uncharacterized protein n=1 Tax=Mycena rosella TaxID=1033263 RepID=A0AAD7E1Q1_MYCRO|nr:hypothetical protein B0H17DRAFT_1127728 [Mycena rosella]
MTGNFRGESTIMIIGRQRERWERGRSKEQHAYKIAVEGVVLAQWDKSCVLCHRQGQASWAGITGAGEGPVPDVLAGRSGTACTLAYLGLGVWMGSGTVKGGVAHRSSTKGQEPKAKRQQETVLSASEEMVELSPNRGLVIFDSAIFLGPLLQTAYTYSSRLLSFAPRTGHWVLMKPEPNMAVTELRRKQFGIPRSSPRSSYLSSDSKPRPGRARRKQIGDSGTCIIPVPRDSTSPRAQSSLFTAAVAGVPRPFCWTFFVFDHGTN